MVVSGYFYPIEGVLGYSDADFVYCQWAAIFWIDIFTSLQVVY
jgi:hypothetical protein